MEDCRDKGHFPPIAHQNDTIYKMLAAENDISDNNRDVSHAIPDVAAAIEDLLEQTSKVQK